MSVLAIDFDNTIEDSNNRVSGYRMGQPTPGAIASINRLVNEGHTIIIFTARNVQDKRSWQAVADWCNYFKIPFHGITNIKSPEMEVFIDNRALHFDSWPQVLHRLTKMQNTTNI